MSWLAVAEDAHRQAVAAAIEGMCDPALGAARIDGPGVRDLADAAVSSATPFLRAPLLSLVSEALALHPADGDGCPTCGAPSPCATRQTLLG